jgi:alkylhydroperoxidase/carboxymuconolactone decarboxylase family protein YurZ
MAEHPLAAMTKIDPGLMTLVERADSAVLSDGALPRKIKLLIALAFDAAHGAAAGVRSLARSALKEGASWQEIGEAVRVAYHLSGVGSVYTASEGLKDLLP